MPPSPTITAKAGAVSPPSPRHGRARTTLKPGAPARARAATAGPGTTGIDPAEGTADLSALGPTSASPPRRLPESFSGISDSEELKTRFLALLHPLILAENERLYRQRQRLAHLLTRLEQGQALGDEEQRWLRELALDYQVSGDPMVAAEARAALHRRVDVIPAALALAQAANESAWGRSRFAREGQNLFGIWTYDESKGMVPKRRALGKQHLVRRFADLGEAVRYYMQNLNSHPAYRELRAKRAELRAQGKPLSGLELAQGLERYSAKGPTYIRLIRQMIVENDLEALNGIRSSQG